jgi:UTP-glucose-1-phosphate uridylyltransferase
MADAVDRLAARSAVIAQPIEAKWMAAGNPLLHLKASIELTLRQEGQRQELIDYLHSLDIWD